MEKINNIEIFNFKSIKHLKIDECNKINVFIGMPNAGKSNILEALTIPYIFKTTETPLKNNLHSFMRFENLNDLLFEGNTNEISQLNLLRVNNQVYSYYLENESELRFTTRYETQNDSYNIYFDKKGNLQRKSGEVSEKVIRNTLSFNINKYEFDLFKSKNNKIIHYNFLQPPFGNNIGQIISSLPKLRKEINELFNQNNLKLLIEKGTNELKIFKEYQDGTVFILPYEMIADTLQRLIFYKAAIMSNRNSVLLFEEPEAHCFEPYILEFTNAVKYDENDNQFFIVTHSDYIIKEFLRDQESKENTNIYLVNNVDGETKVKLLDKDKNEDVFEFGMNIFFNFENLWETN